MNSPETAGATRRSLTQDWLYALQYWLRGRNGVIALVVVALVIGGALNWSWLVAVGIAPLLLTVLPCAVMCGLGLCMNKMTGGSCSRSPSAADHPGTPMLKVQITAAPEPDKGLPAADSAGPGALPDLSRGGAVEPARPRNHRKSTKRGSDMRKHLKTLLVASMLAAGLAAAPAIYAHDSDGAGGSMMGRGMMGQGGMMGQMSSMMENCSQMMQAMMGSRHEPARPNEQWRDEQAPPPDVPRPQANDR